MSFGFNGKQERLINENALSKNTREPFSLEGIHVFTADDISTHRLHSFPSVILNFFLFQTKIEGISYGCVCNNYIECDRRSSRDVFVVKLNIVLLF